MFNQPYFSDVTNNWTGPQKTLGIIAVCLNKQRLFMQPNHHLINEGKLNCTKQASVPA